MVEALRKSSGVELAAAASDLPAMDKTTSERTGAEKAAADKKAEQKFKKGHQEFVSKLQKDKKEVVTKFKR